ncbi:MAG: aspartate aminotransferase family protein [Candidatus Dormibacteria bacterium]
MPELGAGEAQALAPELLLSTYSRVPVTIASGRGSFVRTEDGRELLDLVGGIAVNVLGHCHPEVVEAARDQLARLIHTSNLYFTEPQVRVARQLVASAFPARVFFANSGAEANEAAIKVARKWGQRERGGAYTVLTLEGAFHGRTLATLAATGNAHYSAPFAPLPEGFRQLPRGVLGALEVALDEGGAQVVAVLLEPIQGESGVHVLEDSYLQGVRQLCDRHGCLLILDEIQSGMGRSGRMWAHQWSGIRPDLMTVAKGLGGGLPLGALLVGPRADVLEPGDHGSTFGGNPVACAAASAVLEVLERDRLPQRAGVLGERLRRGLLGQRDRGLPVAEVRGRGLLLGIGLSEPVAREAAQFALEQGLLVNAIGDRTLRLAPPLTLSDEELELGVVRLTRALELACPAGIAS